MGINEQKVVIDILSVEIFSQASPIQGRVNEDRWFFIESRSSPHLMIFAVIDGAGVRKELPSLVKRLKDLYPNISPPAYVAKLLKSFVENRFLDSPECSLVETLVDANSFVRESMEKLIGNFDPATILSELDDKTLVSDLRNLRLVLPACVITLARLNTISSQLEFAHLGDTSLLEIHLDGRVTRHTTDQMGNFDSLAFERIMNLKRELNLPHFCDAVSRPEGRQFIIDSGIRLNYVDINGHTNTSEGCGVINGMTEMIDYLETGVIKIDPDDTKAIILLTDGLEFPTPLHEKQEQSEEMLLQISRIVQEKGLRGLYTDIVDVTNKDKYFDEFPRTKLRDDATGIYIQFEKVEARNG